MACGLVVSRHRMCLAANTGASLHQIKKTLSSLSKLLSCVAAIHRLAQRTWLSRNNQNRSQRRPIGEAEAPLFSHKATANLPHRKLMARPGPR